MTNQLDEFDPAELQGGLLMQVENVHERLREAQAQHRVMRGNPFAEISAQQVGDLGVTVLGYDECQTVLTHPDTFSSSIYDQIMGPVMGRTLLELEGAEHRASRALVSPSFRTALLERWRSDLVEVVVHELIDRFAPRGRAELAREFTFAFPVQVIARIMGLPREDYLRFQRLSIELLNVVYDWNCGIAASASLKAYFKEVLAERRRNPQDDLISTLAESEIDGARLTDDEIFAFLLLILPAGVRDDLPCLGQPAGRPAHRAGTAGRAAGGSQHAARRLRGGVALGAADHHGGASGGPRLRARRGRDHGGNKRQRQRRGRQPGPAALPGPGPLRSHPQEHRAPDVRRRPAPVPGHAPCPDRGDGGAQRAARPAVGPAAGLERSDAACRRGGVPLAGGAAGRVHPRLEIARLVYQPHRRCSVGIELGDAQ